MQRGNAAGNEINALLGLNSESNVGGAYTPGFTATSASQTASRSFDGYAEGGLSTDQTSKILQLRPDIAAAYQTLAPNIKASFGNDVNNYTAYWNNRYGSTDPRVATLLSQPDSASTVSPGSASTSGQDGLNTYLNSTNYKFTTQQGLNALDQSRVASAGGLHSGATLKAISNYGQNTAQAALGTYINYLSGQQGVGLSGANALAGVGTGYANAVSSNNNSAATTAGNAALASASGTTSALGGITNAAGFLGSYYNNPYGSSYGGGQSAGDIVAGAGL